MTCIVDSPVQEDVFNSVVRDVVVSAMDGYNGTVFAYGQTGSGKTHTITGGERYADRGIIPRTLSAVFEVAEARPELSYRVFISYMEIYNENIYDLLDRCVPDGQHGMFRALGLDYYPVHAASAAMVAAAWR